MKRSWLILLLLTGAFLPLEGQVRSEGQTLLFREEQNKTQAQIGFRMREEDDAFLPAEGKGLVQGEFRAYSRHSLDSLRRVEGSASYERGVKRAVNWNTSSDWDLLAPYITLDTVGGDLQKEQYRFAARFASRPGRVFYSLWADYRALHEYRNVDPRPRNVTADLQLSATGGLQMGKYAVSVEGGYRKYHQNNDIMFMDSRGSNTSIMHYLGFGRYSSRFSGAKKDMSVRFGGKGFTVKAVLEPEDGLGWIAGSSFSWLRVVRYLPGYNETPISELLVQDMNLYFGRKWTETFVRADASLRIKTGNENIIDQTSAFLKLSGLKMYRGQEWKGRVSAFRIWPGESVSWTLQPSLAYWGARGEGFYNGSDMAFQYAQACAVGGADFQRRSWKFHVEANAAVNLCVSSGLVIDRLPDNRFRAYFDHLYDRRSAHFARAGLNVYAGRKVAKDMILYVRPEVAYGLYFPESHHRLDVLAAIGIEF